MCLIVRRRPLLRGHFACTLDVIEVMTLEATLKWT
jgi:hypothetical protein